MPMSIQGAIRATAACLAFAAIDAFAAPPDPPDIPMAQAGTGTATVTIDPPGNDGGSAITGYTVTSSPPGGIDAAAGTLLSPRVITGLTNGVQYTFTAIAINADGNSLPSFPSIDVRPALPTATITVDSLLDNGIGCTLRKAIENANGIVEPPHADCVIGGLDNTIVFAGNGTIVLDTALPAPELFVSDRSLTIQGNGAANTIIDGANGTQIFDLCGCIPLTFTLTGVTLTRGNDAAAFGPGAAIHGDFGVTLRIYDSVIRQNQTTNAGAVFSAESVEIARTVFLGNAPVGPGILGGAVAVAGSGTITESLFAGNAAEVGGAIMYGGFVGTSLTVSHSTFTANAAGDIGGAIAMLFGDAVLTLSHVTIMGNTAGTSGGGVFNGTNGTFAIGSSIVASNTAPAGANCDILGTPITSLDFNVFGAGATCGVAANDASGDPLLGPLADNGGPTMTMKPLPTSPARDRATCAAMTDQRGIARPQGPACESGAFEIRLPDAPTAVVATAGALQASVTFTPGAAGDGTLAGHTVVPDPAGGVDAQAGTLPIPHSVTGLVNGTTYTFRAQSASEYGNGPLSAPSAPILIAAVPGAPGIGAVTAGNAQVTVAFTPPASNGGSPITSYTADCGGTTASAAGSPIVVAGLVNGTPYTCTVLATNAIGNGPPSAASTSVTPLAPPGVPTAPAISSVTAGNAQLVVAFTPPVSNGGSAITGYTATCGATSMSGTVSPIAVTGLTNGTEYQCTVLATNAIGNGPPSAPSLPLAPFLKVYSGPSATGSGTITATLTGGGAGCSFAGPQFIPLTGHAASPPAGTAPANTQFPHGLFDFRLVGCIQASTVGLSIVYPAALATGAQYWKYGPEPGNATPHWYVMPSTVAGNTVTFSITDGQLGDDDLLANGVIVDQGGPGVPGAPGTATAVPTLSEWMLMLLATLMLLTVILRESRRPKNLL